MITPSNNPGFTFIYFFYGLAFFSMGLAIILEGDRSSDERLRVSLRPLAAFGILHGFREWMDMFENTGMFVGKETLAYLWFGLKLSLFAFSFLSLSGFGFSLLAPNMRIRRLSLLAPLTLAAIWGFGLLVLVGKYPILPTQCQVACVWTRYSLGIPSALAASFGLVAQQRAFRKAGMAEFGRDSLVAAIAFAWYGLVGQLFVPQSRLVPSTFINENLFLQWFGFPIQVLRTLLAIVVAIYVIRFMRAFDTEIKRQIADLQTLRLKEARRREVLRGGLLRRVTTAQEAERQRIARELHDDTGQTLTAIAMGLRGVSTSIESTPQVASQNLRKLEALTVNAIDGLQRMIANLRPAHIDDLGLSAAFRWYLNDAANHTKAKIDFDVDGEEYPLSDAVKIALYRVAQEAVTNVIKHADASQIFVMLSYGEDNVDLWVEDNGVGIDLAKLESENRQSWGLVGMQERTNLLHGKFEIESAPHQGVNIHISIPYQPGENGSEELILEDPDDN